jgi:drug/metabolite transporter (DMT)-like permease
MELLMAALPRRGALFALCSAILFGATTPFAKALVGSIHPAVLAGLLYLGSGAGLLAYRVVQNLSGAGQSHHEHLGLRGSMWLGAAILSGGVLGPLLLMVGLTNTLASTASLLLNLEGVFTALLAWFVFRENFDFRIALGMGCIVAGALALSLQESVSLAGMTGAVLVVGACFAWAVDNNLTRKVALSDPAQIAMLKGLVAGAVNLAGGLLAGGSIPDVASIGYAAALGFFGYGLSLVLFVLALRELGTARTGAYYSTAPFVGAVISLIIFNDPPTLAFILAALLMGIGVWLHLTENHEHEHEHEPLTHTHWHVHDEHHLHEHGPDDPAGEPHAHKHDHTRLRHVHGHFPDAHHEHRHWVVGSASHEGRLTR